MGWPRRHRLSNPDSLPDLLPRAKSCQPAVPLAPRGFVQRSDRKLTLTVSLSDLRADSAGSGRSSGRLQHMRMFVAMVPPAEVVESIEDFLEPRRDADPDLRWTEPYQWHLTLAFCPVVDSRNLDVLLERLTDAAARRTPPELRLGGSGAFPSPDRARVLWLGVGASPAGSLDQLATGVRAAANAAGVVVEGGRLRPHVTLARIRQPQDATRWLRILDSYDGPGWTADAIELIESHLGQGRGGHPRYETITTVPLLAPSGLTGGGRGTREDI